jgi:hypothetical protein
VAALGSEAWIAAFAGAVERAGAVGDGDRLVVQQELTDTGAAWFVELGGGPARVVAGTHPDPDVTFRQDAATAVAVNAGELTAQEAFLDGRLRVRGAVGRLPEVAAALAALPAVPAGEA